MAKGVAEHKWTSEEIAWLRENAEGRGNKEITEMLNKHFDLRLSVSCVKSCKSRHHISSGLTGCFQKGRTPMNKGKKWDEYLTKEQQERSRKTTFKKGSKPATWVPIGTQVTDKDGYLKVKVTDDRSIPSRKNWKFKHIMVWEDANGPVPKGSKVLFKDGNRSNLNIDNLMLVTEAEMLIMNRRKLCSTNAELTESGAILAKVLDTTFKKKRSKKNENNKSNN